MKETQRISVRFDRPQPRGKVEDADHFARSNTEFGNHETTLAVEHRNVIIGAAEQEETVQAMEIVAEGNLEDALNYVRALNVRMPGTIRSVAIKVAAAPAAA